jgi:hypothetical protein
VRAVRGRSGSIRTVPGREDVRRRDIPGRGQVGSADFGAPQRACYLGTERLCWEGAGRLGHRGTAREGDALATHNVAARRGAGVSQPECFPEALFECTKLSKVE